ncbi:hypothetical protein AAKU61_002571 [Undibacterium sp. GrIS 1.2]|uniref:hypothetical protein n=1 Tax=Undibacterium sp. GrIS 1.2 TaxID=3143933 RepID=UPI00339219B6
MKDRHLRARLPGAEYTALKIAADLSGLTISEHVRCVLQRDQQALEQGDVLAKIDAKLACIAPTSEPQNSTADLEPLLVELLFLIRELVAERNAQVLGRVANQLNSLYPTRKKV